MNLPNTFDPIIAKEAVQHRWGIEASGDEATNVWDQGCRVVGCRGSRIRGPSRWVKTGCGGNVLVGQFDVEHARDSLHWLLMLGMVDEVADARLVLGVPFEQIKLILLERLDPWLTGWLLFVAAPVHVCPGCCRRRLESLT